MFCCEQAELDDFPSNNFETLLTAMQLVCKCNQLQNIFSYPIILICLSRKFAVFQQLSDNWLGDINFQQLLEIVHHIILKHHLIKTSFLSMVYFSNKYLAIYNVSNIQRANQHLCLYIMEKTKKMKKYEKDKKDKQTKSQKHTGITWLIWHDFAKIVYFCPLHIFALCIFCTLNDFALCIILDWPGWPDWL